MPTPCRRSRRRRAASVPSAGRGPSRSTDRRRWRSGPAAARRDRASAACGETSRPSVKAWIHVFSGANRSSACTWSMCEWTPPCETRPSRCTRLPRSNAARSTGFSKNEPSSIALVHAHQILVEPPAGADRQVADLAVSHLTGRQARRLAGGFDRRVRELAPQPVEHRRVGELDGVARARRRAAPAVEDDERYEWDARARHIAANESTSSEAPPTSAPSTAVCESSSAAFSGLTEPP